MFELLFTPQGSLSLVVPDQMHWRGDADFPKVTKDDHEIEAFGFKLNFELLGLGRRWFQIPDMFLSFGKGSLKIPMLMRRR